MKNSLVILWKIIWPKKNRANGVRPHHIFYFMLFIFQFLYFHIKDFPYFSVNGFIVRNFPKTVHLYFSYLFSYMKWSIPSKAPYGNNICINITTFENHNYRHAFNACIESETLQNYSFSTFYHKSQPFIEIYIWIFLLLQTFINSWLENSCPWYISIV